MRGVVYDGTSARTHPVAAVVEADGLTLIAADGSVERIDLAGLRRGARGVLHRVDLPDWRFVAAEPMPHAWLHGLPDVGALSPRVRRLYVSVTALVVVIAACLTWFGDDLLAAAAPLVPPRVTRPIGDAVIASLGAPRCTDPAGIAALGRLVDRLRPPAGFDEPVDVAVVDTPAVNAITAPGDRIAIFRGLIDHAADPDEVAGVLAHELTHVALRHPTKALLRQMGVSLVVQAIGGDIGNAVDTAALLRSSRHAEAAPHAGALDMLRAAHVSPAGLRAFFVRLDAAERRRPRDGVARAVDLATDFAATHPGSVDREARIAAVLPRQGSVTPALDPADWQALRTICRAKRDR